MPPKRKGAAANGAEKALEPSPGSEVRGAYGEVCSPVCCHAFCPRHSSRSPKGSLQCAAQASPTTAAAAPPGSTRQSGRRRAGAEPVGPSPQAAAEPLSGGGEQPGKKRRKERGIPGDGCTTSAAAGAADATGPPDDLMSPLSGPNSHEAAPTNRRTGDHLMEAVVKVRRGPVELQAADRSAGGIILQVGPSVWARDSPAAAALDRRGRCRPGGAGRGGTQQAGGSAGGDSRPAAAGRAAGAAFAGGAAACLPASPPSLVPLLPCSSHTDMCPPTIRPHTHTHTFTLRLLPLLPAGLHRAQRAQLQPALAAQAPVLLLGLRLRHRRPPPAHQCTLRGPPHAGGRLPGWLAGWGLPGLCKAPQAAAVCIVSRTSHHGCTAARALGRGAAAACGSSMRLCARHCRRGRPAHAQDSLVPPQTASLTCTAELYRRPYRRSR